MWMFIWGIILPTCLTAFYFILRQFSRALLATTNDEQAREQFRFRREGLEAQFLGTLDRFDPVERLRWHDADWGDEVVWARDRRTRRLLALVGVDFDRALFGGYDDDAGEGHATVIFEYSHGRWRADGVHLDEITPHEAVLRLQRLEPIVAPPQRRG